MNKPGWFFLIEEGSISELSGAIVTLQELHQAIESHNKPTVVRPSYMDVERLSRISDIVRDCFSTMQRCCLSGRYKTGTIPTAPEGCICDDYFASETLGGLVYGCFSDLVALVRGGVDCSKEFETYADKLTWISKIFDEHLLRQESPNGDEIRTLAILSKDLSAIIPVFVEDYIRYDKAWKTKYVRT